jgi:hypothetical protein
MLTSEMVVTPSLLPSFPLFTGPFRLNAPTTSKPFLFFLLLWTGSALYRSTPKMETTNLKSE